MSSLPVVPDFPDGLSEERDELSPLVTFDQARRRRQLRAVKRARVSSVGDGNGGGQGDQGDNGGGPWRPVSISEVVHAIRRTRTRSMARSRGSSESSESGAMSEAGTSLPTASTLDLTAPRWENPFRPRNPTKEASNVRGLPEGHGDQGDFSGIQGGAGPTIAVIRQQPQPSSTPAQANDPSAQQPPSQQAPPRPPAALDPDLVDLGDGVAGSFCCHPQRFGHRITALVLMCLLGFGSYFCFDNPGALQEEIKDTMHVTTYQFANLYSWYSWPNVILPFVGGYLMDSVFGIRIGTVIFAVFIILGQLLFAIGALMGNFGMMQMGRFTFGIGGESLAVAQNTYAVTWFQGKELNMVFGFQLSVARIGATVNFQIMAPLFDYLNSHMTNSQSALGYTLLIGGSTCIMSLMCAVGLGWMDKRAEVLVREPLKEREKKKTKGKKKEEQPVMKPMDIFGFPPIFWLLSVICLAYYAAIFPFISLGQVFFMKKFQYDKANANMINGLIYLLSGPASPALGILVDKTGRNVMYCFLSILITLLCHMVLAFSYINPYIAIVIMGLGYSLLASALWPIAALIIPEHQLGSAYGLMQAIQNLGLGVVTLVAGDIVDRHGYLWLELFFMAWLVVGMICIVAIYALDMKGNGYLNMGISARAAYDAEVEAKKAEEAARAKAAKQRLAIDRPRTGSELRNRYLCRIGAVLPPHLGHGGLNVISNADGTERPMNNRPGINSINNIRPSLRLRVGPVNEEDEQNIVQFEEPTPSTSQA